MFSLGIISKIICIKKFQNSVLSGSTGDVTANSEIRSLFIVVGGKEIIIKLAAVAYSVVIFVRRFMTIRRFVFKYIRGVLEPYTKWECFFVECKN